MDLSSMERSQPLRRGPGSASLGAFGASYSNMSHIASTRSVAGMANTRSAGALSKLESIASSAVRAAEKVKVCEGRSLSRFRVELLNPESSSTHPHIRMSAAGGCGEELESGA